MKSESTTKKELAEMRSKTFKEIEEILRRYDYNEQDMIGSFVASLCDVDYADMLSASNNSHIAQARWLYWYAMRYFTHDTYYRISERTQLDGHRFTPESIGVCITKISALIEEDSVWKRRWVMTKRMIRLLQDPHDYQHSDFTNPMPMKYKLLLQVPKGESKNIEIEVVEQK